MKQCKKVQIILTVVVICISLLAGCNASKQAIKNDAGKKQQQDSKYLVSDEPIELSIFLLDGIWHFDNEWPVFKKAEEMTNVTLSGTLSKSVSDGTQAFNLMMASGEIADIVQHYGKDDFFRYGAEGAFVALDDLIEQHAPNIKAFLEKRPDVKKFITAPDGKIYYIPYVTDGEVAEGWFIRKDWLDKLGLQEPKTVDEFYAVLKAFKEQDPNGNGQKDEIPYFNRQASPGNERSVSALYIFWDAYKDWCVKDGKVCYGPYEPEFRTAHENIAKWYQEGLIDNEIYTRGFKAREILLGNNTGGSTHDWFGSTAQYNDTLKDKIPGFEFVPFAPPGGKEATRRNPDSDGGWAISSSNKKVVETIKYFDFWFTEEGRRLMNFGIEGVHYDMVDGKTVFKENIIKGETPAVDQLRTAGAQIAIGFHQDFEYERQWLNPIALKGIDLYIENQYPVEQFPNLAFTQEEKKRLNEIMTPIQTYRDEMTQKWILGGEAVETSFDKYLQELRKMGIEEAIKITQTAYDRYMNN